MTQPVFRFAPSPNGYLHLGHAYSALVTATWAAEANGRLLLRIEDIDVGRCRPEFTDAIFDDLAWLGLEWEQPVMIQSTRLAAYASAARTLHDANLLYPCFCTRAEITAAARGRDPDGAPFYPGTCRHLTATVVKARLARGDAVQYRLDCAGAIERAGRLTYPVSPTPYDPAQARVAKPERWGDAVIVRKDVPTSYHLSCVVDDADQEVTHVTRGRDMKDATDLHALLQALLGLDPPRYSFHKLILDGAGNKLSKSHGALSLKSMRQAGETARSIRHRLGF